MDTGPVAGAGFDLALTEMLADGLHHFVVEVGTERGAEVLGAVPHRPARGRPTAQAATVHERTAAKMGRELETDGIKELLYRNLEHPRWEEVAERCLTCGNCTMVCPTCFCTTVEDVTDLAGTVERRQRWDSCFTVDYSYIHGGAVRGVRAVPLSPVDDAQARHLARSVRQLGVRRLRAVHHLVPGGDRSHRGGAGHSRTRRRRPCS